MVAVMDSGTTDAVRLQPRRLQPRHSADSGRAAALAFAALSIAWLLLVRTDGLSFDSVEYAVFIRDARTLFHPHHLIYEPVLLPIARLLAALGAPYPELLAARIHNVIWAGVGAYFLVRIVQGLGAGAALGMLMAALMVSTAGIMLFATQNDVYVPALACTIVTLHALQRLEKRTERIWVGIAIAGWAGATLYHQSGVLLAAPILFFCVSTRGWGAGLRLFLLIAVPAGAITLLLYVVGFLAEGYEVSAASFIRYIFLYAFEPSLLWAEPSSHTLRGLYTTLRSDVEAFFYLPWWPMRVLAVGALILATAASIAIVRRPARHLVRASAVGILTSLIFRWWWLPREPELAIVPIAFYLLILAAGLATALGMLAARVRSRALIGAGTAVAIMAAWNLSAGAKSPLLVPDEAMRDAARLARMNATNCLILDFHHEMLRADYFFGQNVANKTALFLHYLDRSSLYSDRGQRALKAVQRAPCLLFSTEWLDPKFLIYRATGETNPDGWRALVLSLFTQKESGEAAATLPVSTLETWDDPAFGRMARVTRDAAHDMPEEKFWAMFRTQVLSCGSPRFPPDKQHYISAGCAERAR
jgi:hypothetical protein